MNITKMRLCLFLISACQTIKGRRKHFYHTMTHGDIKGEIKKLKKEQRCGRVCVYLMSLYLCEMLQLSTAARIRNQTQSHLTSCELRSVTKKYAHIHMHAHPCVPKAWRNRATGHTLFPQASREEGSKGWWSHQPPTVNLLVTQCKPPSPLSNA